MTGRNGARRVAIVGIGYSTVGRNTGLSLEQLTAESVAAAIADAGVKPTDIDGVASHCFPHQFVSSYETAAMMGLSELTWMSGSAEGPAFLTAGVHAAAAVASGTCEMAVAIRTIQRLGATGTGSQDRAPGRARFLHPFGAGQAVQWAALFKQRVMHEFGWPEEAFGRQMVAQREFATLNPGALLREPMTLEDYLSSRYVSKPLRLFDCDYPVDASGAVIFTTEERARDLNQTPVFVASWSFGTSRQASFELISDMTTTSSHVAAARMWSRTSLAQDVHVAGLYDGFSVITLNWLEALGFCGRGEAADFVADGHTRLGGRLPVNCDGGAANVGRVHGVNHVAEVVQQLRGRSGAAATGRRGGGRRELRRPVHRLRVADGCVVGELIRGVSRRRGPAAGP